MAEMTVKVGPKGQILIPKVLRDEYGISPYGKVRLKESKEGIVVARPKSDAVRTFRKIAFSGKSVAVNVKRFKEDFEAGFPKG